MSLPLPSIQLHAGSADSLKSLSDYDGTIVVFTDKSAIKSVMPSAAAFIEKDQEFGSEVQVLIESEVPGGRVILAPTGTLDGDFDDARRFTDIAQKAVKRALAAGIRSPVFYFADPPTSSPGAWTFNGEDDYSRFVEVTLLGALAGTFDPINVREHHERTKKEYKTLSSIGVVLPQGFKGDEKQLIKSVEAIEAGRRVAKDIGSPDPERMSPINVTKYVEEVAFKGVDNIKLSVIEDLETIKKEYPLAHAVTRASLAVPRHHPRIVLLEYRSPDQSQVKENLFFVGKGVTYDTGGADIKCSGHMRDMSRDKGGAAAVAGFLKTVSMLAPKHVNITAGLSLVRNSVGPDSYVSDEVLYSRNGTRVLVGNTDAEGRMVMTDLLCQFKERALAEEKNKAPSFLFTVATLTGHALRAYGGYGITLDNGFARHNRISKRLYDAGHVLADPFEISTLRREDVDCVQPGSASEDVVQANDKASSLTDRGHQYPAGFMLIASGLEKYGLANKEKRLGYTHLDIAGSFETMSSVGWSLPAVVASPIPALSGAFLL
ncbi:hypothetical protein INT44_000118 [Umbelopsis vinacea]|uniref:Cytosol aminopeptidase domain-containing protein n=1 Tax=Umbelopsis vinacea TaxID=44442 RepID=A0A8H7PI53_9FUNG|nr:hypothetical protein INT44_000118 [Umbelopsis vinacea]